MGSSTRTTSSATGGSTSTAPPPRSSTPSTTPLVQLVLMLLQTMLLLLLSMLLRDQELLSTKHLPGEDVPRAEGKEGGVKHLLAPNVPSPVLFILFLGRGVISRLFPL